MLLCQPKYMSGKPSIIRAHWQARLYVISIDSDKTWATIIERMPQITQSLSMGITNRCCRAVNNNLKKTNPMKPCLAINIWECFRARVKFVTVVLTVRQRYAYKPNFICNIRWLIGIDLDAVVQILKKYFDFDDLLHGIVSVRLPANNPTCCLQVDITCRIT